MRSSLCNFFSCYETQQLILGTGTAIWYLMEHRTLENVNYCLETNIYSNLETSGCKSSNLYFNVVHFFTPVLIRHLWQQRQLLSCIGV